MTSSSREVTQRGSELLPTGWGQRKEGGPSEAGVGGGEFQWWEWGGRWATSMGFSLSPCLSAKYLANVSNRWNRRSNHCFKRSLRKKRHFFWTSRVKDRVGKHILPSGKRTKVEGKCLLETPWGQDLPVEQNWRTNNPRRGQSRGCSHLAREKVTDPE